MQTTRWLTGDDDNSDDTIFGTEVYRSMDWEDYPGSGIAEAPCRADMDYLAFANDTVLVGVEEESECCYRHTIWASVSTGAIHIAHERDEATHDLFVFPSLACARALDDKHRASCTCGRPFAEAYCDGDDCTVEWLVQEKDDDDESDSSDDKEVGTVNLDTYHTRLARQTLAAAKQQPLLPLFTVLRAEGQHMLTRNVCAHCRLPVQVNSVQRQAARLPSVGCPRVGWFLMGPKRLHSLCRRCYELLGTPAQAEVACHGFNEECTLCTTTARTRYARLTATALLTAWVRACYALATGAAQTVAASRRDACWHILTDDRITIAPELPLASACLVSEYARMVGAFLTPVCGGDKDIWP